MSDKTENKPKTKAKTGPRKMRVIMAKNYCPEGDGLAAFQDNLGRLPKGEMVELPKKLADELIAKNIAQLPNA